MSKDVILLLGDGGHAAVVRELIELHLGPAQILVARTPNEELEILSREKSLNRVASGIGDNFRRSQAIKKILEQRPGIDFPTLIHPRAIVSNRARIGAGAVIMAGAIVNPGAVIGQHCVINTGAIVEHDCKIGDFASLATGARLGGTVKIGTGAFIGMGASVLHATSVGDHTVVGAGAVVTSNLPERVLAYGVPARVARSRKEDEAFL